MSFHHTSLSFFGVNSLILEIHKLPRGGSFIGWGRHGGRPLPMKVPSKRSWSSHSLSLNRCIDCKKIRDHKLPRPLSNMIIVFRHAD